MLGEGRPYRVVDNGPNNWQVRTADEQRLIQYRYNGDDLEIMLLEIRDELEGGGHILRIAAELATVFRAAGLRRIKGYKFRDTPAGATFRDQARSVRGYDEGDFTVLDIDDFQQLRRVRDDNRKLRGEAR